MVFSERLSLPPENRSTLYSDYILFNARVPQSLQIIKLPILKEMLLRGNPDPRNFLLDPENLHKEIAVMHLMHYKYGVPVGFIGEEPSTELLKFLNGYLGQYLNVSELVEWQAEILSFGQGTAILNGVQVSYSKDTNGELEISFPGGSGPIKFRFISLSQLKGVWRRATEAAGFGAGKIIRKNYVESAVKSAEGIMKRVMSERHTQKILDIRRKILSQFNLTEEEKALLRCDNSEDIVPNLLLVKGILTPEDLLLLKNLGVDLTIPKKIMLGDDIVHKLFPELKSL